MSKMMVSEEMKNAPAAPSPLRRLLCWEGFLLAVTLAVFIGNAVASPYFLNIWNLSDATFTFTEKAIVVLPMAMLIIAREIDLSVASTMALSSTVMGFCAAAGMDTPLLVVIGLGVGLLCGLFNGLLVTRFNLSSIVITIGTMSLYRGITYILLGDQALNHYPESFAWFGQGYVWGALSFEFALFILLAAAFTFLLPQSVHGKTHQLFSVVDPHRPPLRTLIRLLHALGGCFDKSGLRRRNRKCLYLLSVLAVDGDKPDLHSLSLNSCSMYCQKAPLISRRCSAKPDTV